MSRRAVTFLLFLILCGGCRNSENVEVNNQASESPAEPSFPDANMDRADVPERFRWDISPLFESADAFEQGLTQAESGREELRACSGNLADPERLHSCLNRYFEVRLITNRATLYSQLEHATDHESSEIQSRVDRSQSAMNQLMSIASTMRGEILALDDQALAQAYSRQPALEGFRPYIESMHRRRDNVLSDQSERILSLAGDNLWAEIDLNELPSDHERAFTALLTELPLPQITDESGDQVQLTLSNYGRYRASEQRHVRRDTVEGFFAVLRQFDQTFAATLGGQARYSVFLAKSRGYDTALDAYLHRDNIDPEIYRNLVRSIEENVEPLHRYMRFRKQRMNVEELHIYDLYTPLVPSVSQRYSYERASEIIEESLQPLGEEYLSVLRTGMNPENGWIDLYPHSGKESGAFSAHVYGNHPYVFMNYFEELDDLLTLAHEYGHAIHSHYTMENQPYITSNYVPMVAETASTFNEVLVLRNLIRQAENDDERLYLLGELVETIRTTIYRQALFASFELAFHTAAEQDVPITSEFLDRTYTDLLQTYYGEALTIGENDGMEWAYVPHFYFKFYMYSYALGLSSGIVFGDRVLGGGQEERDAYHGMLSAGSSRPPLEILREAGVDPSQPQVIEAAAQLMDDSLSQMEEILSQNNPS